MKKYFAGLLILIGMAGTVLTASAEPERLLIKNTQTRTKELTAVAQIKSISLQDIEDPAARKAIQQILNYLGLVTQDSVVTQDSGLATQK